MLRDVHCLQKRKYPMLYDIPDVKYKTINTRSVLKGSDDGVLQFLYLLDFLILSAVDEQNPDIQ
jgi:hypothetical protein